tara:strand:+ start:684 stop:1505 length:822 start_codon:yes stop_codon:yes gene_type:complete
VLDAATWHREAQSQRIEAMNMEDLLTLMMLIFLQAVLGFDNLLYISLESKRVEASKRAAVRKLGIGLAIGLRIALLFGVLYAIDSFQEPLAKLVLGSWIYADLTIHSAVVLAGGVFIIYTAFKEIMHLLSVHDIEGQIGANSPRSPKVAIAWITVMNLVFSFDSILSAIALTDTLWVMVIAIVLSGVMMMVMADRVAQFLERNRMYEVLGLFILLVVGIMLLSEGGHLAHLKLFGYPVEAMSKTTFYFSIAVMTVVDIAQSRYQKILNQRRAS